MRSQSRWLVLCAGVFVGLAVAASDVRAFGANNNRNGSNNRNAYNNGSANAVNNGSFSAFNNGSANAFNNGSANVVYYSPASVFNNGSAILVNNGSISQVNCTQATMVNNRLANNVTNVRNSTRLLRNTSVVNYGYATPVLYAPSGLTSYYPSVVNPYPIVINYGGFSYLP